MALQLARHIECLGGVRDYDCVLLHPSNVGGREISELLQKAFRTLKVVSYKPILHGWPDGPNQCFSVAAETVYGLKGKDPWLWLEVDCVPTRGMWVRDIASEYRSCENVILGGIAGTFGTDGKIKGKHVTGVAVYPHNWWKTCPLLRSLISMTDSYRRQGHTPPAFDTLCAAYTVPRYTESKTIRHYWKSHSFRSVGESIECEFKYPYGISNQVDLSAALVHGCKDFSLLDIVQGRLSKELTITPQTVTT